jgi:hypothetical protein
MDDDDQKREMIAALAQRLEHIPPRQIELTAVADPTITTVKNQELWRDIDFALHDANESVRQTAHQTVAHLAQNGLHNSDQ